MTERNGEMEKEQANFSKFLKKFSIRLVQTLVQSRQGDFIAQPCTDTNDWFNMKMDELGEISAYLKTSITQYPPNGKLAIEFILHTTEGQSLPLEAWVLSVDSNKIDSNVDIWIQLYHQMGTLLRSVATAARMTPMHRLYVKKQDEDSFIIMYKIHDASFIPKMGNAEKKRRLGELDSPFGAVCLDLVYRTTMQLDNSELDEQKTMDNMPSFFSEGVFISKGEHIDSSSPMSATLYNFSPETGKSPPEHQASKPPSPETCNENDAAMGTSQNAEDDVENEDVEEPVLDQLRRHSIPFASLLQSAYAPLEPRKESPINPVCATPSSLPDCIPEEKNENSSADENEDKNDDDEEEEGESFVEICRFGDSPDTDEDELARLLDQLRHAPDIKDVTFSINLKNELEELKAHKEEFEEFVEKVNSVKNEED
ncbi:unnamed protein product [Caenorhabditis bovis]|uniref:Autophagy-related protein 13 n=1 Tax=Caenorhabditis bovis TaxID=2654633 RepID=A0A8S1EY27_9PELO|nr:unnamed protein product [Caenorhabditis bovis]